MTDVLGGLTAEKREILQKAWQRCFHHIYDDTTLTTRWKTTLPALASSTAEECSQAMLYELFDIAAYDDMDVTMLRFLRARKFNVEETLKMLLEALIWRAQVDVRGIMQAGESALSPKLVEAGMYFIWGHDREDRPIVFFNIGNFIPPKSKADSEDFKKYLIYHMETARYFIGTTGIMALVDLSNFARKHIDLEFAKGFAEMFQSYYPEILGRALVVGGGFKMTMFETAWAVAKYFLDVEVRRKVSLHKAKDVPQFIDAQFVPTSMGGTFDEAKIRATVPSPRPAPPAAGDLRTRQLAEMTRFRGIAFDEAGERGASKARLRSLWLEMAQARPQNLYERLGLLRDGKIDWHVAQTTV